MRAWQLGVAWALGGLCLVLAVVTVALAWRNQHLDAQLQGQRAALERSILAPQKQQIGAAVLEDIARVASTNDAMRALLARHGYELRGGEAGTPAASPAAPAGRPETGGGVLP
jgi:hypothetical protein